MCRWPAGRCPWCSRRTPRRAGRRCASRNGSSSARTLGSRTVPAPSRSAAAQPGPAGRRRGSRTRPRRCRARRASTRCRRSSPRRSRPRGGTQVPAAAPISTGTSAGTALTTAATSPHAASEAGRGLAGRLPEPPRLRHLKVPPAIGGSAEWFRAGAKTASREPFASQSRSTGKARGEPAAQLSRM
jgi:hypothetical protein